MARRTFAIAGAGVAGLACAALLGRQADVVVFDKLSRPQPLGSGLMLQPVGMAVLDLIGLGEGIRAVGAPIRRLLARVVPTGRVALDVRYSALGSPQACGFGVHRGALFERLLEAAKQAGATVISNAEVVARDGDGRLVFVGGRLSSKFDLIIDALGSRSPLSDAPKALLAYGALWGNVGWQDGFDPGTLEQRLEAARRMVGVLPIGRQPNDDRRLASLFWSLRRDELPAWRSRPLEVWKRQALNLWPALAPLLTEIESHDQLVFAVYAHRTAKSAADRGFVRVGDSWHSTSPQLGQGANMALLDALALACALEAEPALEEALGAYVQARVWQIRIYQAASWGLTPAYQSDSGALAALRDLVMAPLARLPVVAALLAALVAGAVGAPLSRIRALARGGLPEQFDLSSRAAAD